MYTFLKSVNNERGSRILFQNIEDPSKNREIPRQESRDVGCGVPRAESENEFTSHHIEIQKLNDAGTTIILFAIWQQQDKIRFSTTGRYQDGAVIPDGDANAGYPPDRALRIDNVAPKIKLIKLS